MTGSSDRDFDCAPRMYKPFFDLGLDAFSSSFDKPHGADLLQSPTPFRLAESGSAFLDLPELPAAWAGEGDTAIAAAQSDTSHKRKQAPYGSACAPCHDARRKCDRESVCS